MRFRGEAAEAAAYNAERMSCKPPQRVDAVTDSDGRAKLVQQGIIYGGERAAMTTTLRNLLCVFLSLVVTAALAAPPFEGHYRDNGKDAKLNFVTAAKGQPFSGQPVTLIVFSEKEAPKDDKYLESDAGAGKFGDAIAIQLTKHGEEWWIISIKLVHSAWKQGGSSSDITIKDVNVANGEISGHLMTRPGAHLFDEPIDVDLQFHVKQP
jgi:hypothetical protein